MTDQPSEQAAHHELRVDEVELIGGARTVTFRPGLNLVRGDITTGKTTLIRLLHGLLGSIPSSLPPETSAVRALRGRLLLGTQTWNVYRPMVTSKEAPVEVASAQAADDGPGSRCAFPRPVRVATGSSCSRSLRSQSSRYRGHVASRRTNSLQSRSMTGSSTAS